MNFSPATPDIDSGSRQRSNAGFATEVNAAPLVDTALLPGGEGEERVVRAAHRWYAHLIALWAPGVIEAAFDLGVFDALAKRPLTSDEAAKALGCDPRATRVLLDALFAYELVERTSDPLGAAVYVLPSDVRSCLLPDGLFSLAGKISYDRQIAWDAWRNLGEAVRTGSYTHNGSDRLNQISSTTYEQLVRGINFWAPPIIDILAGALESQGWSAATPYRMLDVGCGTGLYGQLLANRLASMKVTGIDIDRIAHIAVEQADRLGVADRFKSVVLDFQNDDWDTGFDLVFFANIFHLQTPSTAANLVHKAAAALSDDGVVAIADHIVTDDPDSPSTQDRFFRLFAASMLATGGGDAYLLSDYDAWLAKAGLKRIALLDTPMHRILLAAHDR